MYYFFSCKLEEFEVEINIIFFYFYFRIFLVLKWEVCLVVLFMVWLEMILSGMLLLLFLRGN